MDPIVDHLLRTLAAVPLPSRVLQVGCSGGEVAELMLRLGFDLYVCDADAAAIAAARARLQGTIGALEAQRRVTPAFADALGYPDQYFDWVVAYGLLDHPGTYRSLPDALVEVRRVLKTGGWLFGAFAAGTLSPEGSFAAGPVVGDTVALDGLMASAGFSVAEGPRRVRVAETEYVHGIYRRVDEGTPG